MALCRGPGHRRGALDVHVQHPRRRDHVVPGAPGLRLELRPERRGGDGPRRRRLVLGARLEAQLDVQFV